MNLLDGVTIPSVVLVLFDVGDRLQNEAWVRVTVEDVLHKYRGCNSSSQGVKVSGNAMWHNKNSNFLLLDAYLTEQSL